MVKLGEGWKKLKGRATPQEDQQYQLTQTPGSSQRLNHQSEACTGWSKAPGTYVAEDCLIWPQWEKTPNPLRLEAAGSGETFQKGVG